MSDNTNRRVGCSDEAREILDFLRSKIRNIPERGIRSLDLHIAPDDVVVVKMEVDADFVPDPAKAAERLRAELGDIR